MEFESVFTGLTYSQGAGVTSGGASEIKFEENIPMAECMAYGTHHAGGRGGIPVSQCLAYGVFEGGQQMREGENDAYEVVEETYEPVPN